MSDGAQPRDDTWQTDVFTEPEWDTIAGDLWGLKIDRHMRRKDGSLVSRKPVWPPQNGDTEVLVENRGQRPVVHMLGKTIEGIAVATCGVSPPSTLWTARQLVSDGFVGCKHCWDRQ